MAAHAIWSGAINFGLVTIPVKLFTAVRSNDMRFVAPANFSSGEDFFNVMSELPR